MLKHTDQRVKLMNQMLVGIRVLKMYAWEAAQEAMVSARGRSRAGGGAGQERRHLCGKAAAIVNHTLPSSVGPAGSAFALTLLLRCAAELTLPPRVAVLNI
jgi:hypothetical protein